MALRGERPQGTVGYLGFFSFEISRSMPVYDEK